MTKYLSIIFAALLVFAFLPACNGGDGEGDADQEVTPDQPTEDAVHEDITTEELPGDPPAEDQPTEDVTPDTPVDTPEEEVPACPPDDADHIYINVDGTAQSLDRITSVEGINVAPISPLDALTNPTPVHLDDATVAADGSFAFDCLNVDGVTLGLVILADDTGAGTIWYPTGTGVKAWTTDAEKTDITGATIFAVTETTAAAIEALTEMDFDATGVVMGLVVDETGDPIDGAEVVRADATALAVDYVNATMDGLETDGNTSALGAFVVTEELTLVNGTLTANATGYTFGDHPSATKDGFIYFMVMQGTPD